MSALRHNVNTNTNINVKPYKPELWLGSEGFIKDLNSSKTIIKSSYKFQ